ncbi:MAG: hypothetical protein IJJ80_01740 [Clostridia bacterium]|nr:hypothetical protein [Clostridia bacterium]
MKDQYIFDKKDYKGMYDAVLDEMKERHPYRKALYVSMSREEYAEYIALSYCKGLQEIMDGMDKTADCLFPAS